MKRKGRGVKLTPSSEKKLHWKNSVLLALTENHKESEKPNHHKLTEYAIQHDGIQKKYLKII